MTIVQTDIIFFSSLRPMASLENFPWYLAWQLSITLPYGYYLLFARTP